MEYCIRMVENYPRCTSLDYEVCTLEWSGVTDWFWGYNWEYKYPLTRMLKSRNFII